MANELDEMTGPVNGAGRDINVIEKQLPVRVGWGSALFEIVLWCLGILPGLIFLFMKIGANPTFQIIGKLEKFSDGNCGLSASFGNIAA